MRSKRLATLVLAALCATGSNAQQWVRNDSRAATYENGLEGRHIAVWASHGRYYDKQKGQWKWQRPNLFGTTEDLFSQTFVLPYLIPMLERAGAVVWSPRERDWQTREVIVDNDRPASGYAEVRPWKNAKGKGFALHAGTYTDGENPFEAGTVRVTKTVKKEKKARSAYYHPTISTTGDYAVYVSYKTLKRSTSQAQYTVCHQGIETRYSVNQQIGGGTWVYLGTFRFDANDKAHNYVAVSNFSPDKGVVTTDAVRFGGGMGNIERGGTTSGLPRFAEGARYWAQWAGAPWQVVSLFNATNDYNDDINSRSLMENWLAGGSSVLPDSTGLGIPFDASLALHTDAGCHKDDIPYGTLTIVTTDYQGRTTLGDGRSRQLSKTLATDMVEQVCNDLSQTYGINWPSRSVWDKNYNECRRPEVPSCIVEMLSHQSFADMRLAHDPDFKFTLSRAVYKSLARFLNPTATIAPLAPNNFRISLSGGRIHLAWNEVDDPLEPSASPTAYILYNRKGQEGFDNGTLVKQQSTDLSLTPDEQQNFQVTAINRGGESFPSETLAAVWHGVNARNILVVNGFHRLSGPAVVNSSQEKGFDLDQDAGVSYLRTAGWAGSQTNFDASQAGKEGAAALGYGGNELAGQVIAGNTFDYVSDHVEAIRTAGQYNVVSCSMNAVEQGLVSLTDYDCIDIILGLEKDDGHSLKPYKSFSPSLQHLLADYTSQGGNVLVSGCYVGSDMQTDAEQAFLSDVLKVIWDGTVTPSSTSSITGMGKTFDIYNALNEQHYAASHPDALLPASSAFSVMTYQGGQSAAVAYQGNDYKAFTMGFPWECIKDKPTRQSLMRGILQFLLK